MFKDVQTEEMYNFKIGSHYFMAMSIIPAKNYLCTVSKIYRWSSTHEKFTEHQILTTRGAKKFASFNESGSSYLLVATMAKPCSIAGKYPSSADFLMSLTFLSEHSFVHQSGIEQTDFL